MPKNLIFSFRKFYFKEHKNTREYKLPYKLGDSNGYIYVGISSKPLNEISNLKAFY
jgi:hypothetical protein